MKTAIEVKEKPRIEEEMQRLFSEFSNVRHHLQLRATNLWHPATDVYETPDKLIIISELAGIEQEDINLGIHHGVITISGIRKEQNPEGSAIFHNLEINCGPFERNIRLPERFIGSEPRAKLSNGILKIVIPIAKEKKTIIDIEVTS